MVNLGFVRQNPFQIFLLLDAPAAQEANCLHVFNTFQSFNIILTNTLRFKENYTQQISRSIFHKPNCVNKLLKTNCKKQIKQNKSKKQIKKANQKSKFPKVNFKKQV